MSGAFHITSVKKMSTTVGPTGLGGGFGASAPTQRYPEIMAVRSK